MSTETITALTRGDISPAQFWIRHIEPWTLIADATTDPAMDDMYRDLADAAADLGDSFAVAL